MVWNHVIEVVLKLAYKITQRRGFTKQLLGLKSLTVQNIKETKNLMQRQSYKKSREKGKHIFLTQEQYKAA